MPHDIAEKSGAWDPAHIICDDELHDLFVQLPNDVLLEVYLDTCHSGTGLRGAEFGPHAPKPRYIAPPEHEFGDKTAKVRGFTIRRDVASHMTAMGRLFARLSAVAMANPLATRREGYSAERLATISGDNLTHQVAS